MRQRRLLELLNDNDRAIHYHLGNANVVADTLSSKERVKPHKVKSIMMTIQSNLILQIRSSQLEALTKGNAKEKGTRGMERKHEIKHDGTRYFVNQVWVPKYGEVKDTGCI